MKTRVCSVLVAVALGTPIAGCGHNTPTAPTQTPQGLGLTISAALGSDGVLRVGQHSQVKLWVSAPGAKPHDVTAEAAYTSDKEEVATVAPGGLITAVGSGTCQIIIEYQGHRFLMLVTVA